MVGPAMSTSPDDTAIPLLPQPPRGGRPEVLYAIAAAEAGDQTGRDRWLEQAFGSTDAVPQALLYERRQNLRRFARDLPQAAAVIDEWIGAAPTIRSATTCAARSLPPRRLRHGGDGVRSGARALPGQSRRRGPEQLPRHGEPPTRYYFARAELKLALTQARAGDRDQAQATYQQVIDLTTDLATAGLQGAADDHLIQTRYHALLSAAICSWPNGATTRRSAATTKRSPCPAPSISSPREGSRC